MAMKVGISERQLRRLEQGLRKPTRLVLNALRWVEHTAR